MSERDYRIKVRDYIGRMNRATNIDGELAGAAKDWMNNEFAEMDREKQKEAIAGPPTVRQRLIKLFSNIIPQSPSIVKGAK